MYRFMDSRPNNRIGSCTFRDASQKRKNANAEKYRQNERLGRKSVLWFMYDLRMDEPQRCN